MIQKISFFIIFATNISIIALESGDDFTPDISNISYPIVLKAQELIKFKKKSNLGTPIISIAGCSAAGKTEFTKALKKELKKADINALILKQDDFMNPLEIIPDYILHPHLDHKKIHEVMKNIKNGVLKITKPKFDWKKRAVVYENIDLSDIDIILFEGLYVITGLSYGFVVYSDIRIFINAKEEDIIEWNWQRENSGKVSHTPRNREKFDKDIAWDMEDYRKNILTTKINADFVIEKDKNHTYSLTVIR